MLYIVSYIVIIALSFVITFLDKEFIKSTKETITLMVNEVLKHGMNDVIFTALVNAGLTGMIWGILIGLGFFVKPIGFLVMLNAIATPFLNRFMIKWNAKQIKSIKSV